MLVGADTAHSLHSVVLSNPLKMFTQTGSKKPVTRVDVIPGEVDTDHATFVSFRNKTRGAPDAIADIEDIQVGCQTVGCQTELPDQFGCRSAAARVEVVHSRQIRLRSHDRYSCLQRRARHHDWLNRTETSIPTCRPFPSGFAATHPKPNFLLWHYFKCLIYRDILANSAQNCVHY